ncbi:MAG: sel1 repeat family protein [Muribaculaceae bacterium]|nr:sel1 repeat family protein [Muribaculaceae bacterium]
MKKLSILLCMLIPCLALSASNRGKSAAFSRIFKSSKTASSAKADKSESMFESVSKQYAAGKISADSVVSLAKYHKIWSPELAERCLTLVGKDNSRAALELGALYTFSPEFSARSGEGLKLLEQAAKAGQNEANCYLGLYYFNHKDYKKAKSSIEACNPMYGLGYTILGSMYTSGSGVPEDLAKARENFHQAALKGYPRGMALYGFNLRASAGGPIDYPDSFFWLYNAGDMGDDAARTALYLPARGEARGDSETARDALTALQMIAAAQSGKKIQNEPIYKDGFLPSLKNFEKAAEQGDDWARFYLGGMNYNGDFLNQNYKQALHYYEPIARNGKLPAAALSIVHERLAKIYAEGKGVTADSSTAARHMKLAAKYGSLHAYKTVENIKD